MLLTPEERLRFIEYCIQQSSSLKSLVEQMEKCGSLRVVAEQYKSQARAYMIVAGDLGSVRNETITPAGQRGFYVPPESGEENEGNE